MTDTQPDHDGRHTTPTEGSAMSALLTKIRDLDHYQRTMLQIGLVVGMIVAVYVFGLVGFLVTR